MEHTEQPKKYKSLLSDRVAEYDPVMGLFYITGIKYTDGTMMPFQRSNFEGSANWEPVYDNIEQDSGKEI